MLQNPAYKDKYQALFEHMIDGFIYLQYVSDSERGNFRMLEVNPAFCHMMKRDSIDAESSYLEEYLPMAKEKYTQLLNQMAKIAQAGNGSFRTEIFAFEISAWLSLTVYSPQADHIAIILSDITGRKKVEERLEVMSWRDPLTNLYNRRYFENIMRKYDEEIFEAATVFSIDLDGLKLINDMLGHLSGDDLLTGFADVLRLSFRQTDIIARVGGDEFATIIPGSDINIIKSIEERMIQEIANHNSKFPGLPLGISFGYAVRDDYSMNMTSVYNLADEMMYHRKQSAGVERKSKLLNKMITHMRNQLYFDKTEYDMLKNNARQLAFYCSLPETEIAKLELLSDYFDLGKIAVRENVLRKAGPLNEEEWEEMTKYCENGYRQALTFPRLISISEYILRHHEHFDGSGYPGGLIGENIPEVCRIFYIVEAYAAMRQKRPYRPIMTKEQVINEIEQDIGKRFDPNYANAFLTLARKGEID